MCGTGPEPGQALIARHADLPQNQISRRIDHPAVQHELARLEMLAAHLSGVDSEVRVEAILRRDPRLHVSGETLLASQLDGFVRGPREYARVAVESCADTFASTDFLQH